MKQNIFDNQTFFDGYKQLRENRDNANLTVEKPCFFSLLPPLDGKSVLDMGCGYGENCREFSRLGASFIQGIDVSEKMLEVAIRDNAADRVNYRSLDMEEIRRLDRRFDVVVSSMAVHYVEDFQKLAQDVFFLLSDNGVFIFSQEHPLTTAPISGVKFVEDDDGSIDHYCVSDYSVSSERSVSWFVDNIIKYHRTFSDLFTSLSGAGFCVDRLLEPLPPDEVMSRLPKYRRYLHKPDFLVIRAIKRCL